MAIQTRERVWQETRTEQTAFLVCDNCGESVPLDKDREPIYRRRTGWFYSGRWGGDINIINDAHDFCSLACIRAYWQKN